MLNGLYGDQERLVDYLIEKGGFAPTEDILKHLGFKEGNQLAGIRSSLTRNARRETGYKSADVVEWAMGGSKSRWGYKLIPEVHELFKQVKAESQE